MTRKKIFKHNDKEKRNRHTAKTDGHNEEKKKHNTFTKCTFQDTTGENNKRQPQKKVGRKKNTFELRSQKKDVQSPLGKLDQLDYLGDTTMGSFM